ncbi:Nicotinamide mononucleotide adenylyltransferase 1 [Cyphomyrmex costatus]|uniref:Nicotinamide/nicotinic acid mononucleotide adenylyltransferase 3 n=1 Tax=Cyphomyrmex costatus TaxID=456900 RepID=A0A195CSC5_9HYME|nr:Nicotinamide mononucleotide adenylyltransferase 1 [Cyphomyrmex costatus]
MAPTRVILMSCGSYNPPTNMHLRMFEIARDHLHRLGTHVVVGGVISPVHDAYAKKELASATHRCAMLRLALQNSDWIRLSTWETRQNCWTKTRMCLQHHQNLLNSMLSNSNDIKHHMQIEDMDWIPENVKNSSDNMPIQIKLLCGADLLESFGIPGLWLEEDIDTIVGEHGLVVITREGSNPNKFIYDSDILSKHMNNICIVTEWIPNEVSSTRIRRALKRGESVRYLLQDSVIDYIYKHEIYDARMTDTTIKLELSSPNANNYLHIDPRYLTALLTPSPSDVTMGSPSPVEIVASIDVPDAVVLRKNLQNAAGGGGGLDEIREQFVSMISNNADNSNIKHVSRVAYPGQAKQIIASVTGVARILDEVGALDEPMAKSQPGPSSEEGHRRLTIDSITRDKEVLNLGSKAEIIDVDLGSSEINMKVSPNQLSSNEFVPKECSRSIRESVEKGQIEIGQKENLRSKMEVTDVDLDSNDDRKLIMKVQSSESSSGELRLGECCWPKKESATNDEFEICDRKIMSGKMIIDAELGLDDKNALKETRRSTVEAISDEVNSDRSRFSRIGSEKSSKSIIKSVVDGKVSNKEMINVEFTDVVKVQPVHSSHGILMLKDDRRLMIEKLTNELKSKLDEEKNKFKENSQIDKVGKNDTELTELNTERDMKNNVEIDDVGIGSGKETADFESRTKYLDAKAITSSLNISMTSLDGRHECALSDFSVDKEDYRLSQYGSDEDEEKDKKPIYTARLNLTKYADGQIEDMIDNVDFVNDYDSNNCTKSSDKPDQLKYIVEESFSVAEVNDKDNNFKSREQTEEIFRISQETDKMSTIEKGSELDMHSSDKPMTSCDSSLEIDGKYIKSIVNSRKSPRKIKDGQVRDVEKQNRHVDNRETSRIEDHSSKTSSIKSPKKTQTQKTVKMNDNKGQQAQEAIKTAKDADNKTKCDFNEIKDVYTRKVRRYNVPLQGSLDSMIVSDETSTQKPKKDDAFSKKSKSYESIKRIQEVFLGVPPAKANSSGSQLDIPDEFCSICCYMNEITFRTEEEVSSPNQETFYTLRSACSSLADDDDSIECDICGSLNLQESADDLEGKVQEIPCELCKICGEVDGSFDQDSTLPADRYTFKMIDPHQDDDDSFEIENCGFQSGTESADDRSRISDKERIKDPGRSKSQSLFIHGSSMNRDQPRELYFIPKDEIAILTSGTRKVNRKGSLFRKKEDSSGNTRDKRRYSSVDSLQLAKMSSKGSDKVLKVAKNTTLIGSADNLRISRDSRRSKSLQRPTDNVCKDRLNKSTDNLNSQMENLGKENEAEDLTQKLNIRDKEEVKMILTQHGIKIISEKETAL